MLEKQSQPKTTEEKQHQEIKDAIDKILKPNPDNYIPPGMLLSLINNNLRYILSQYDGKFLKSSPKYPDGHFLTDDLIKLINDAYTKNTTPETSDEEKQRALYKVTGKADLRAAVEYLVKRKNKETLARLNLLTDNEISAIRNSPSLDILINYLNTRNGRMLPKNGDYEPWSTTVLAQKLQILKSYAQAGNFSDFNNLIGDERMQIVSPVVRTELKTMLDHVVRQNDQKPVTKDYVLPKKPSLASRLFGRA